MVNTTDKRIERCPDDGELLAHLDGELSRERARAVDEHLGQCEDCRVRRERLKSRALAVGQWIRRHDPPMPELEPPRQMTEPTRLRGRKHFRWTAAAAVLLLVAVGGGPLLGWVVDRFQAPAAGPESSEPPIVEAPNGDLSTSFGSSDPELTLSFESPDTRGSLELEAGTDSIATVVVPAAEVGLFILRDRLEVDNTTRADGAYRLVVPRSVLRIRVQIPGRPLRIITTPDVGAGPLQVSLESDHEAARRQ